MFKSHHTFFLLPRNWGSLSVYVTPDILWRFVTKVRPRLWIGFRKMRVWTIRNRENQRLAINGDSVNGYAALRRLDAMIMGLRYWERLGSTMTGEFANRLMALARCDAITVHRTLSVTLVCSALSLTKPTMIAVITPNCLMAGKWMIIVLERHERECLRVADSHHSPRPMSSSTCAYVSC